MSTDFERNLATGNVAEGRIARYFIGRGYSVMPVYEIEKAHGKGPQVFTPTRGLIAPDMFVFKNKAIWVEAKHKTVFSWHFKTECWTTGIDLRHYRDYLALEDESPWPVWLTFLHVKSEPDVRDVRHGCPEKCPTGLFANSLDYLRRHEHHVCPPGDGDGGWGRSGMVYWARSDLKLIAQLAAVPENTNLTGTS
jgi:hypothetical protein